MTGPAKPADTTGARIIDAAREEFVRYGIRGANMEQIGRRAGVSRVTVYRRFERKPDLLRAVVMAGVAEFVDVFDAAWYADGAVEDRIVNAVELAVVTIRRDPLLGTLMRSEPESVLQALTSDGAGEFELIRGLLAARIDELVERGELPAQDHDRTAEVILRLAYTVVLMPFGVVPGGNAKEIRAFARRYILPLLLPNVQAQG